MDKRIFLILIAFSMVLGCTFASTVTRAVYPGEVSQGTDLKVTLTVDIAGGETFYVIDEKYPAGWTIKNAGTGAKDQAGHLKWVVIQDAKNTTYDYTITAPSAAGAGSFSGTYMFEGMTNEATIEGSNQATVSQNTSPPPAPAADNSMLIIAAIVVIIIIGVVAISMKKKK